MVQGAVQLCSAAQEPLPAVCIQGVARTNNISGTLRPRKGSKQPQIIKSFKGVARKIINLKKSKKH